jgi:flagellar biosynthesis/type III secretory pathway M-ring protein FliF/YscJ
MSKRLLVLVAFAAVLGVILRRRRRAAASLAAPDPAHELRRKLDEARELETPAATVLDDAPDLTEDLEARRRSVHERGRQAAEEMHRSAPDSS